MSLRTAVFLSIRNFRRPDGERNYKRLMGAVLGVFLSLVPLIVVIEVANGMIEGITSRFIEIGTYHLQTKSYGNEGEGDYTEVVERLRSTDGISSAFPFIDGIGLAYAKNDHTGVSIRALPQRIYDHDPSFKKYLGFLEGEFNLRDKDAILLSREIAERLNIRCGDTVKLMTAKVFPGRPAILRPNSFTVTGIFTTGYHELDSLTVYIPFERGLLLFQEDKNLSVGIKVDNPYNDLRQKVSTVRKAVPPGWYVFTWYELEKSMYRSFETTRSLLIFIMVLIVAVASVNISSTLVMIVIERQQEIAILKCTGTSPSQIQTSFIVTGAVIGAIGTVLGITAGLLISIHINETIDFIETLLTWGGIIINRLLYPFSNTASTQIEILDPTFYLEEIPVHIKVVELLATGTLAILLSTIASYFPAKKAGNIRPLEILRKH